MFHTASENSQNLCHFFIDMNPSILLFVCFDCVTIKPTLQTKVISLISTVAQAVLSIICAMWGRPSTEISLFVTGYETLTGILVFLVIVSNSKTLSFIYQIASKETDCPLNLYIDPEYEPFAIEKPFVEEEEEIDETGLAMRNMFVCMGDAGTTQTDDWFSQVKISSNTRLTTSTGTRPSTAIGGPKLVRLPQDRSAHLVEGTRLRTVG